MYARIVVPLDGSQMAEGALPHAETLARQLGAPLHLVHVIDMARAGRSYALAIEAAAFAEALERESAVMTEYMEGVRQELARRGLEVTVEQRRGLVAQEIVALTRPNDLVVMASHGRGGLKRMLLGSVAEEVVRHASVPVLLIRACTERKPQKGTVK